MNMQAQPRDPLGSDEIFAALDLGTNNCRLLIAYPQFRPSRSGQSLRSLDSFSRIVRLGEGLSASGKLSGEAMERTLDALRACKRKLDKHNVSRGRYVATEACRQATNAQHFIQRIHSEIGLDVEIISTEEEARLALLGCCSLLSRSTRHALAFDIGGGSTEVMWVEIEDHTNSTSPFPFRPVIRDWISVPFGVMNLSERFGDAGYAELYFEDVVTRVEQTLRPFDLRHRMSDLVGDENIQLISTSGTVTTLAAVHLGLQRYDRSKVDGSRLPVSSIQDSANALLAMRPSERFLHPCIGADRSDYILAGCAIFEAIARIWPFSHITIADRGVREGIIASLMLDRHHGKYA